MYNIYSEAGTWINVISIIRLKHLAIENIWKNIYMYVFTLRLIRNLFSINKANNARSSFVIFKYKIVLNCWKQSLISREKTTVNSNIMMYRHGNSLNKIVDHFMIWLTCILHGFELRNFETKNQFVLSIKKDEIKVDFLV